ncbi:kinase-like protein, partial [Saccharata proteae CBS 121410]
KGISIAGYEVVRVLGKGSFGLVKLVKEKPQPAPRVSPPKSSPANTDDSDIEMLDGIGSGATSPVKDAAQLAKQVYAMKVIRKSDMLRNCQEGHLKAERDFLVASETSRWVVPLIASFQDHSNLYLVMEYMVGGDFLGLLLREDVLSEYAATWYIAEMILCIEEAHKMNWIHRDVKPDNFLITASGHLKISDFGLAFDGHWAHNQTYFNNQRYSLLEKFRINIRGDDQDEDEEARRQHSRNLGDAVNDAIGRNYRLRRPSWMERGKSEDPLTWLNRTQKRRLAKSVVGTSQYMAPEVIRGEEYDGRSDWWSIGVIMYECLYGSTPFYSETRQATKEKIVRHNEFLRFPGDSRVNRPATERNRLDPVSFVALNFMCQLLTAKQCRLSARHYHDNDMPDCPSRRRFYPRGSDGSHRFSSAPPAPPPQKFFVHPDDAADIKAHPIFRGIDWEHLHLMEPPFVPRIRKEADLTRYFEAEEEIVSGSEGADSSDFEEGVGDGMVGVEAAVADAMKGRRREKKRPRDKLLRDPVLGRCVLEARKKGAFVGYTYRRPSEGGRAGIPLY